MRACRRGICHRPRFEELDGRCLPAGLIPAQLASAYGLDAISFTSSNGATVKGDGSGQTIALIEAYHDPNLASDLRVFDRAFELPDPILSVVNQAGTQTTPTGPPRRRSMWMGARDRPGAVSWSRPRPRASRLAGGREHGEEHARSGRRLDELGVRRAAQRGLLRLHFTTPAGHAGITFVTASGDDRGPGGSLLSAASPNVLSVGGTRLIVGGSGTYHSESAWVGSGGGYSRYEPEPGYQAAVQSTGRRSTPDVAFDADPYTGVAVYRRPSTAITVLAVRRRHKPGHAGLGRHHRHRRSGTVLRARGVSTVPPRPYRHSMDWPPRASMASPLPPYGGFGGFSLSNWPSGGFSTVSPPPGPRLVSPTR